MDKSNVRDIFSNYVKEKGLKWTGQRALILDEFLASSHHVTAEELYSSLKKKNKNIGFATIYRTLRLLNESNIIHEIKVGKTKALYEEQLGSGHHDHLICVKCGNIIEACDPKIEELQGQLAEKYGLKIVSHKLEIYGYCAVCRKKAEKKK